MRGNVTPVHSTRRRVILKGLISAYQNVRKIFGDRFVKAVHIIKLLQTWTRRKKT